MDTPRCHCGKQSILLQTKKAGVNFHRWFYGCRSRTCNFFKWIGKRCVDPASYTSRMKKRGLQQGIEGSGVINAIRDRCTTVKFQLRSNNKIAIIVGDNGYSLLSCIRQLPDATFDAASHEWNIPATFQHYTHTYQSLLRSPFYRSIHCTPLSELVIKLLKHDHHPCMEMTPVYCDMDDVVDDDSGGGNLPYDLFLQNASLYADVEEMIYTRLKPYAIWGHLMEYQQQGVRECLMKDGRVLLADEMGLGKTIQALAVALVYSDNWPVLIICPTSLLLSWSDQIQQWLSMVSNKDIRVTLKGTDLFGFIPPKVMSAFMDDTNSNLPDKVLPPIQNNKYGNGIDQTSNHSCFYIISYEVAASHSVVLAGMDFKVIICDESHSLKNSKTKRTISLTPLLQKGKHVLLLTGTPILSRPIELYPQLCILRQDLFPDMIDYGMRYCNGRRMKYGWDFTGASNLPELNFILEKSVMVRRLKENVPLALPSKVRQKVMMTIDQDQKLRLAKLKADMAELKHRPGTDMARKAKSMELYKATGTAKISPVTSYLQTLLPTMNGKIILFAYHKDVLDAIESVMKNEKIGYIRIDGTTKQTDRHNLCLRFQSSEQEDTPIQIAILSITASNVGLNFQEANTVIFAELYWNPSQILQAEDRAHRIGQVNTVNIKYLISEDTADDWLWDLLGAKLQIMQKLLD
ncbi:P-loop containing nucleoside triphosphate hydrolase protein [Absidia repens]|uniref:p-loop containing nucleoside triphosphate hydrolase protein n=1 Tax=Absidia repens TaxID=90262 RepID=A0A1X2I5H0_9FUNG|nr:P-loop containing nucleoside triphosphate hydrolase protein [Absidia repens]